MNIRLERNVFLEKRTFGKLFIDGEFFGYTLEDKYRGQLEEECDKVQNETAIPCGKYKVIVDYSAHFDRLLPHILDVPRFTGVRMHGGNTEDDTEGCVLTAAESDFKERVWNCKIKVEELTELIQKAGEAEIEIINV
jgi:hypothetical protein